MKKLIKRYRVAPSTAGFMIPIAVGLGLMMLLVVVTMIMRSQGDRAIANSQSGTGQGLAVADGSVSRSLSTLNVMTNAFLLALNYDPNAVLGTAVDQWSTATPTVNSCGTGSTYTLPSDLLSGTIGSGSYQLKAYKFNNPDSVLNTGDETGTLVMEGTNDASSANANKATSRIQVTVPIVQQVLPNTFPGLYASNSLNLGNNDLLKVVGQNGTSANVICRDCTVPNPTTNCQNGQPTLAGLQAAVGAQSNSIIDGKIYLADPNLPAVPTAPTTACSGTTSTTPCSITIPAISGTMMLPRTTDATNHTPGTPYRYKVPSISLSGTDVLTINSTSTDPVYLYVDGDITFGGNASISHSGSPNQFQIYGNPTTAQSFTLNGGANTTNVFIYAPNATMGINGGSSDPDILGAIWVKTWDGSSSNQAEIRVPDNMGTLLGSDFSNVGIKVNSAQAPKTWQKQEVQ